MIKTWSFVLNETVSSNVIVWIEENDLNYTESRYV